MDEDRDEARASAQPSLHGLARAKLAEALDSLATAVTSGDEAAVASAEAKVSRLRDIVLQVETASAIFDLGQKLKDAP